MCSASTPQESAYLRLGVLLRQYSADFGPINLFYLSLSAESNLTWYSTPYECDHEEAQA